MQHNSPGCLWESFKIPPNLSLQLYLLPGIGSELWGISKGSHVLLLVCCCACRLPNALMPAVASELFQDCLPLLFCSVVSVWFCVDFVFFFKINMLSVACWQPSIFRSNITAWCTARGIKRNRRWHWVLLKFVIYCLAPLQVWWQRTDSRQICLPWLKGVTAGL